MGLIDKVSELLPWRSERHEPPPPPPRGGVLSLCDNLDHWLGRLLDEARGFPFGEAGWTPSADVHETEDELVVAVEVPGLDPADLDLMITPSGLIIRGDKHEVREERPADVRVTPEGLITRSDSRGQPADRRRDVHVAECHYGAFVRTVPLPAGIDLDRAEARVVNGVLTVHIPKTTTRAGTRRIPIQA
jgi:HSP20 family protein